MTIYFASVMVGIAYVGTLIMAYHLGKDVGIEREREIQRRIDNAKAAG